MLVGVITYFLSIQYRRFVLWVARKSLGLRRIFWKNQK